MGCDIHLYREKQVGGKWVAADNFVKQYDDEPADVPYGERFTDRNYKLFAFLCDGVRGSYPFSMKERGMPLRMCDEIKAINDMWGQDGHSHSYLYLHELKEISVILGDLKVTVTGMKEKESLSGFLKELEKPNPDYDKLYPYCGWASDTDMYAEFEVELPVSYLIGEPIDRIVSTFDDCDGENHRIVFWFDN